MTFPILVTCVLAVIFFVSSIRILKEYERAAIFRLGQFVAISGPGLVYLIPVVDKAKVVNLKERVPDWQGLSKSELDERVRLLVLSDPAR